MTRTPELWSGRAGFILATIGSAVGLGSVWKFPYEVGSNGGTAFVFFYLIGLAAVVVPLMFAEFAIGRRGRGDAASSIAAVAKAAGSARAWALVGVLGIVTGFLILSFYSVIGGWTIAYVVETAVEGLAGTSAASAQERFDALLASPLEMAAFHGVFMAAAAAIVARGVGGGIEAASKLLMPVLAALLLGLAVYSVVEGDLRATLRFLFSFDLERVNAAVAIEALGLGFFSIGVGLGVMITYAAYAGIDVNLRQIALISASADTVISFLAGFAVFPIVFAHGLDPAGGAGLVFVTLPLAFADLPLGRVAAVAFFALLFVAALASAISMLELAVAVMIRRFGWRRGPASAMIAAACFVAGLATVLSFNAWAEWHPLASWPGLATATVFDLLDGLTSNIMLPLSGFALSILAGWALPARFLGEELRMSALGLWILRVILRFVAPAGIAAAALAPLLF